VISRARTRTGPGLFRLRAALCWHLSGISRPRLPKPAHCGTETPLAARGCHWKCLPWPARPPGSGGGSVQVRVHGQKSQRRCRSGHSDSDWCDWPRPLPVCTPLAGSRPGVRLGLGLRRGSGRQIAIGPPSRSHRPGRDPGASGPAVASARATGSEPASHGHWAVLALARYDISSRHRRGAVTRTLSTVYGYRNFSNVPPGRACRKRALEAD
jgi:hypothetical protein